MKHKKNRIIKSEDEISKIKKAVRLTEQAIAYAHSKFKLGMTEKDVAVILKDWAKKRNLKVGFCIVQGDKNTALIHSKPDDNKIEKIMLIDFGIIYKRYFGDITRTYLLNPSREMKKVYAIVLNIHKKAIAKAKHGMCCDELHNFIEKEIKKAGYKFLHSTGHGIGLQVHEYPRLKRNSEHVLENGMIFTIEPGIYLKNKFGVRIEDDFAIINKELVKLSKLKYD